MEPIRIKIAKTPLDLYGCARVGCTERAVHRIREFRGEELLPGHQDFCEEHFQTHMLNARCQVVED
jgi:hypothetical protein